MAWDNGHEGYFDLGPPSLGTQTQRHFPLVNKPKVHVPLAIKASVRFPDLKIDHSRTYEATEQFSATDELWDALLHRLEHLSEELITRKDTRALSPYGPRRSTKPLKYEIQFHLTRPSGLKEKIFRSFQKQPTTMDQAREVILATDRMVGPFLKRHDKAFRWAEGPVREHFTTQPETARPSLGGPQSLLCVPRLRFIESTQDYEFVPGYEVVLTFRSTCSSRRTRVFCKTLRLASRECVPLSLELGEDVLRRASRSLDSILDSRRRAAHSLGDRRAENGAVTIDLRVKNNLGPDYDHLCHSIRSKQALFTHPDTADCLEFLEDARHKFLHIVGETDLRLGREHELEIVVSELGGSRWTMDEQFTVYLDDTVYYSQRSIEAVLERVQTGISDLLRGHPISIGLSASYRGHLVLDKRLVAHEDAGVLALDPSRTPEQEKDYFVCKLKQGIWSDIIAVCKDTCEPRSTAEYLPNLHISTGNSSSGFLSSSPSQRAKETAPERDSFVTPKNKRFSPAHLSHDSIQTNMSSLASSSAGRSHVFSRSGRTDDADSHSTPPSTPSLMDGDGETPRDSLLMTPPGLKSGGINETASATGGLRIADDEVTDTVTRDFGYLGEHVEEASQRLQSRFHGAHKMPDTPTPVRDIVAVGGTEDEDVPASPSKMTVTDDADADVDQQGATSAEEEPTKPEPIMEGFLEYYCEPLNEEEDEVGDTRTELSAVHEETGSGITEEPLHCGLPVVPLSSQTAAELPLCGVLEYCCEELDDDDGSSGKAAIADHHDQDVLEREDEEEGSQACESITAAIPPVDEERPASPEPIPPLEDADAISEVEKGNALEPLEPAIKEEDIGDTHDDAGERLEPADQILQETEVVSVGAPEVENRPLPLITEPENSHHSDDTTALPTQDKVAEPVGSLSPPEKVVDPEEVVEEEANGDALMPVKVEDSECDEEIKSGPTSESTIADTEPCLNDPHPPGHEQNAESEPDPQESDAQQSGTEPFSTVDNRSPDSPVKTPEESVEEVDMIRGDGTTEMESNAGPVLESVQEPQMAKVEEVVLPEPPVAEVKNPFDNVAETPAKSLAMDDDEHLASDLLPEPILPTPVPKKGQSTSDDAARPDSDVGSAPSSRRSSSNALIPRPVALLQGFRPYSSPFLDSADSSPILRPRSAIPFGRPAHLRNRSISTANYLGLHEEQGIRTPLGDVLFGRHSRPQSSYNSPALRPVTAHGLLSTLPRTDDAPTMGEPPSEETELRKASKKEGKKEGKLKKSKEKVEAGGHRILNSMVMFAAGVTIASSMVRRS